MKIAAQVEIANAHLGERCRGRSMTGEKVQHSEFVT
jgi:hypothetical protein